MSTSRRRLLVVGGALATAIAIWWALDALVVTDEERLQAFVDDVTGPVTPQRIDEALRWVDPSVEPVEVRVLGRAEYYEEMEPLRQRAHRSLDPVAGTDLRTLQQGIDVNDGLATVSLRELTDRGMLQVTFTLHRHEERWLVSEVQVHR